MNAYTKIQLAMKQRERELLTKVERANAAGRGYDPVTYFSKAEIHAAERLEKAGVIRYKKTGTDWGKHGYWMVKPRADK